MSAQFGQYPPARQTIVHLSDPHFLGGNAPLYGVVDTEQHLAQTLDHIRAMQIRPSAFVFTGDLADLGEPDAYARLRALVEPVAADLGAQLIWLMGNHDERAEFRAGLFGAVGSTRAAGSTAETDASGASVSASAQQGTDAPVDVVYDLDGLRFIGLDSSVPGWHHGALADEQLEWLADVLSEPAEHGTIVGLHHPPVPSPLSFFDILELQEQHCARHPGWAPALQHELAVRGHPRVCRRGDVLHHEPHAPARPPGGRRRRPVVQPRARLRRPHHVLHRARGGIPALQHVPGRFRRADVAPHARRTPRGLLAQTLSPPFARASRSPRRLSFSERRSHWPR
jgi:hypothetical protein